MSYLIGFILASAGLIAASIHLNQGASSYWDFVAFSVVFCGTMAVLIMTKPKMSFKSLLNKYLSNLFGFKKDRFSFAKKCFSSTENYSAIKFDQRKVEEKILSDGYEMIELGFSKEVIEDILTERYLKYKKNVQAISSWIKRTAKYPPAFGLGGTVIGLINLMNAISAGGDPKETGIKMAVALVATFYGILLANLVFNPMSEAITEHIKSDEELVEMAIKTILMKKEESNLLEFQEMLNSFLIDEDQKIDFLKAGFEEQAKAA